tara:strand:+ start:13568 stop:14464 length:897 start_codon:yes stop_codon:yes gene_type:complete
MLIKEDFSEFIDSLKISEYPSLDEFQRLGDMTALFYDENAKIFLDLNYERGQLLYLLISKLKPKNVLEIGTATGYGTLSMAWAMDENNLDGKIYTIDPIPNSRPKPRAINDHSGKGPEIKTLSVFDIWKNVGKDEWIEKIVSICGYSGEILNKIDFPKFDFIFIDGAHFFDGVKHDFFASLNHVNNNFSILFDDYVNRESYGIKKLIDNEISKKITVKMIKTDTKKNLEKIVQLSDKDYGMCFLQNDPEKNNLLHLFPEIERKEFIKKYLKFEKRIKNRERINKMFPALKNKKLSFWK